MRYEDIRPAVFLARPNRFVAVIETEKGRETAHVMNTGRCRELLIPERGFMCSGGGERDARPVCLGSGGKRRKTDQYGLPGAQRRMGGGAGRRNVGAGLRRGAGISTGGNVRDLRLDFQASPDGRGVGYMEIKGVTLEEEGIARFPDAPTVRGGAPFARADPGGGAGAARGGGVCHPNGGSTPVRAQRGHRSRLCPGPVRSGGRRGDGAGLRLRGHARFPADSTAGGGAAVAGKNWI